MTITDIRLPGRSSGGSGSVCKIRALSQEACVCVCVFANVLEAALKQQRLLVGSTDFRRALEHRADVARAKGIVGNLVCDVHVHSHAVSCGREVVAFSAPKEPTALRVVVGSSGSLRLLSVEVELSVGHLDSSGLRQISVEVELIVSHLDITSADVVSSILFGQKIHRLVELRISSRRRLSRLRERHERLLRLGRRHNSIGMPIRRNSRSLLSVPVDLRLVSVQPILASERYVDALFTLVRLLMGVFLADVLLHVVRTCEEPRTIWPGARVCFGEPAAGKSWSWGGRCRRGVGGDQRRRFFCCRLVVVGGGACALLELLVRHVSRLACCV